MSSTQEYFEREKQSRLLWHDYYTETPESVERIEIAKEILWEDEVEKYIVYEEDDEYEDWSKVVDEYNTDRDWINEAIDNYYELLSIEKRVQVDPYDSSIILDKDNAIYKLAITIGWPGVFREIDWTAELHLYWWGEHYSRDFGSSFADDLLSFYWLE